MKKASVWLLVIGLAFAGVLFTGCESGGDGEEFTDVGNGSSKVSGILNSVSGDYVPAGVQGITVDLQQNGKTILRTVTEASGRFTFFNVPAGAFTLVFYIQGTAVESTVSVPESGDVVLGKVFVSQVGKVEKVEEEEAAIVVAVTVEPGPAPAAPVTAVQLSTNGAWSLTYSDYGSYVKLVPDVLKYGWFKLAQTGDQVNVVLEQSYFTITSIVLAGSNITINANEFAIPQPKLVFTGTVGVDPQSGLGTSMSGAWTRDGDGGVQNIWKANVGR